MLVKIAQKDICESMAVKQKYKVEDYKSKKFYLSISNITPIMITSSYLHSWVCSCYLIVATFMFGVAQRLFLAANGCRHGRPEVVWLLLLLLGLAAIIFLVTIHLWVIRWMHAATTGIKTNVIMMVLMTITHTRTSTSITLIIAARCTGSPTSNAARRSSGPRTTVLHLLTGG